MQVAVGILFLIERRQYAGHAHFGYEAAVFFLAAVAPVDVGRAGVFSNGVYPFLQSGKLGGHVWSLGLLD